MDNVVVTGASRGLGLAIATRLAHEGYRVIAVARKCSDGLETAMTQTRGGIAFAAFDLCETAAISAFARDLRSRFGPIYGLVNNAGIGGEAPARQHARFGNRGLDTVEHAVTILVSK